MDFLAVFEGFSLPRDQEFGRSLLFFCRPEISCFVVKFFLVRSGKDLISALEIPPLVRIKFPA